MTDTIIMRGAYAIPDPRLGVRIPGEVARESAMMSPSIPI